MNQDKAVELGHRIETNNPFTSENSRGLWVAGVLMAVTNNKVHEDDDYALRKGYEWGVTKL